MSKKRGSIWGTIFVIALLLAILFMTALCQKDPKTATEIPWFLLILGWCSADWLKTIFAISVIAIVAAVFYLSKQHESRDGN